MTDGEDADSTALTYTAVGMLLTVVAILTETFLDYGLLIAGVCFAVAGFVTAWREHRDEG